MSDKNEKISHAYRLAALLSKVITTPTGVYPVSDKVAETLALNNPTRTKLGVIIPMSEPTPPAA